MNMAPGDTVELSIETVAYRGKGLARSDGYVIFTPGVLAGETILARLVKCRADFAEAEAIEILHPSPARIPRICPITACPGCAYAHASCDEEIRIKQDQLLGHLRRTGLTPDLVDQPIPSPSPLNYRNKIVLHADRRGSRTDLGYVGLDNRTVIDIPACPLAAVPLNDLLDRLRHDESFVNALRPGMAVGLRHTAVDGPCHWIIAHGGRPVCMPATRLLTETVAEGSFRVPIRGFFQVNPLVVEPLIRHVVDIVKENRSDNVLDLYCGVGVFTLSCAKAGVPSVTGADSDRLAIEAARTNAREWNLPKVRFVCGLAGRITADLLQNSPADSTTLIVDPPRRGLEREVLDAIGRYKPKHIIYISCAADTMARDALRLKEHGYTPTGSRLVDMFPRTAFFESVTNFALRLK